MKKLFARFRTHAKKTNFYPTDVWSDISERRDIKTKLWSFVKENYLPEELGSGIILYGEVYGAGIQKGYDYGMKDIDVVFFDMTVNGEYMPAAVTEVIIGHLDLPHVEILYEGYWSQEIQDKHVLNNFIKGTKVPEEGVVIKNHDGNRAKTAKVINPDYLIFAEKNDIGDSH